MPRGRKTERSCHDGPQCSVASSPSQKERRDDPRMSSFRADPVPGELEVCRRYSPTGRDDLHKFHTYLLADLHLRRRIMIHLMLEKIQPRAANSSPCMFGPDKVRNPFQNVPPRI